MAPPGAQRLGGSGRGSSAELRGLSLVLAVAGAFALVFGQTASAVSRPAGEEAGVRRLDSHASADLPIPAFSRLYGTACSTCHTAAPKLNVLGEAFRLNGYRMPESQLLVRRDDPVSLGAPEWDELWPRAIPSSDLPGIVPLALRITTDAQITRDERKAYGVAYRFPESVHAMAATPLGRDIGVFADAEWSPEDGLRVTQAKVEFQDVVPALPKRSLNVWVGLQNPFLLTFADEDIDGAETQLFEWQRFRASRVEVTGSGIGSIRSPDGLVLGAPEPALELNGLVGGRFYYGAGLAQGTGGGATETKGVKDFYYKLRYKFGGLSLAGAYDSDGVPAQEMTGQLLDRALVLETFGYFGNESTSTAPQGGQRAFGLAGRALLGRLDLGAGFVTRSFDRPWSELPAAHLDASGVFGKAEYLFLPWAMGSLKAERFRVRAASLPSGDSVVPPPEEATRVLPGLVLLVRQNVRLVAEGEIFVRNPETDRAGLPRPDNLWIRLDVAF